MESRLGGHGHAYKNGAAGISGNVSRACLAAGAALVGLRAGRSRLAATIGGALLSAGAVAARLSVFRAGFQSAAEPGYVIGPQRAGIQRGQRPGAARSVAKVSQPDPRTGSPAPSVGTPEGQLS
jgi:hypothetical protein